MGKADAEIKNYFKDADRFADLMNGVFYDGRRILEKSNLHTLPGDMARNLEKRGKILKTIGRYRDILYEVRDAGELGLFSLYGIEAEFGENPVMPAKVMVYDSTVYLSLAEQWMARHRKWEKDAASFSEYYAGLPESEKFVIPPIRTLVLYLGTKKWTSFSSLHEMMHLPETELADVPNYTIRTLELNNAQGEFHNEDNINLMQLFSLASSEKDKNRKSVQLLEKLRELGRKSAPVKVLQAVTGRVFQEAWKNERGANMYNVVDALYAEAVEKGLAEGKAEGLAEGKAEGLAEGKAEGLAEGKAEGMAKGMEEGADQAHREITLNLLRQGILSRAQIAEITRLPVQEVNRMAEENSIPE